MDETSFPWPAGAPIPLWLLLEVERWCAGSRVGRLVIDFGGSGPQGVERIEKLRAPETGDRAVAVVKCPTCKSLLRDVDYGNRWECDTCRIGWSRWTLKEKRAL